MIAPPPLFVGAVTSTVKVVLDLAIDVVTGADGTNTGVEALTASDAKPIPFAFTARIFTWYAVALGKPVTFIGLVLIAFAGTTQVDPPSSEY